MPWNIADFNLDDEINREIWEQSPGLQQEVHEQNDANGDFGCQQAMLGAEGFDQNPLPWVPDLVGEEYGEDGSLLTIGSTYAPFIVDYGGRDAIDRESYSDAESAEAFLETLFFPEVVQDDYTYYGVLADLLGHDVGQEPLMPQKRIALTDLCRGSFVRKHTNPNGERDDTFGDNVVNGRTFGDAAHPVATACRSLFNEYVRHEDSARWTLSRIRKTRHILALGSVAEHGVLKLLASEPGCVITENESGSIKHVAPLQAGNGNWTLSYTSYRLYYWLMEGRLRWWRVKSKENEWLVLPIYHPSTVSGSPDNGYLATKSKLKVFLGM